ncbi:MAG: tRNA uridine-5-carboxymethylaminomethyl(34) synthesis GTPase MnmE [Longimicrobiales bacterium]|nr:tRNA uridine-5-carboxymethylaminomethyl(34) synthesis GTPase MnmE [Longimicrobiales bacterium]
MIDTIAAIATPPGVGALAVLRISGPRAFEIAGALATFPLEPPRTAHLVTLRSHDGEPLDQGVVTLFPDPASYTGEEMVEISTHGGHVAPRLVLDALLRAGARLARAGEFTERAWLNGKLDLLQAEAVADLVEGSSRALHAVALQHLDRGLSRRLAALRERIVGLEAQLVHHIDFPGEDDAPVSIERLAEEAGGLAEDFDALAASAPLGRLLRDGVRTVLAGSPNAGKSSLLNALVGEERAIVTEVPGTTRDRIEVGVEIEGLPFVLVDTAGLRDSDDTVERLGVRVARETIGSADLVLLCIPVGAGCGADEGAVLVGLTEAPILTVRTKADLGSQRALDPHDGGEACTIEEVRVSSLEGTGLDRLRGAMVEAVFSGVGSVDSGASVLTRERQLEGVRHAGEEVRGFADALSDGVPPEVASAHLKGAVTAVEELLGTIGTESVLDRVFSDFCIGK